MGCAFGHSNVIAPRMIRKSLRVPTSSVQDIRKVYRFDPRVIGINEIL